MATEKRIASNRKSALESAGPKTPEGKAVSKMNAFKHGIYSKELILDISFVREDPEEFQQLVDSLVGDLRPQGTMETILAEKIAVSLWRIKRIYRAEIGHFNKLLQDLKGQYDYPTEPDSKQWDSNEVIDPKNLDWARRQVEFQEMSWDETFEQPEFRELLEEKHPDTKLTDLSEHQLKRLKASFRRRLKNEGAEWASVVRYQRLAIPMQQAALVPDDRMGQQETRLERSMMRDLAALKKLQEMRQAND